MVKNWKAALAHVKAALLRRGRTSDDADDLVQEAFLRLASYERGAPVAEPDAFLMRTALNLSIDAHRARATRGKEVEMDESLLIDTTPGTEAVVLAKERMERLSLCIGRLSDKTRAVFIDIRLNGLSHAEVAKRHGINVSTVEKHMAKATLLITECMDGW